MYGYIYKITNLINQKIYVGQKKASAFVENYWGSGKLIKAAISKYGKENFDREILEWCASKQELDAREIFWISELKSREFGYNLTAGGGGAADFKHSEESIRKTVLNRPSTAGENNPMFGVHRFGEAAPRYGSHPTEETRAKISQSLREYYKKSGGISEETRAKLQEARKGKPKSDAHKKSISNSLKGKDKTAEHRAKLSIAAKQRRIKNTCLNCGNTFLAKGWKKKYCDLCSDALKETSR